MNEWHKPEDKPPILGKYYLISGNDFFHYGKIKSVSTCLGIFISAMLEIEHGEMRGCFIHLWEYQIQIPKLPNR